MLEEFFHLKGLPKLGQALAVFLEKTLFPWVRPWA